MIKRTVTPFASTNGFALVLALIFLVILSGIGIFLAKRSNLELRMTSNLMGKTETFEYAEEARITAEAIANAIADNISAGMKFDCNRPGHYAEPGTPNTTGACSQITGRKLRWDGSDSAGTSNSRYTIEYQGRHTIVLEEDRFNLPVKKTDVHGFRITTRGYQPSGSRTTLETIYLRRSSS